MADDNIIVSSSQSVNNTGAANVSLLKLGTMAQTVVGVVITTAVLAATLATVLLISLGSGYQPPVVVNDYSTAYKTIPIDINALFNDRDPKGGNLTIVKITSPFHGSASIINGKFIRYTSPLYYSGRDSFNYTVSNDKLFTTGAVFVDILNNAPELSDFNFTISKNSAKNQFKLFEIVLGDSRVAITDMDNDLLFIVNATEGTAGTSSFDEKSVYYTPNVDSRESDQFLYFVTDRNDTRNATIHITVQNDAPVANPSAFRYPKNTVVQLDVLVNCYDINNDPIFLTKDLGYCLSVASVESNSTIQYIPLPSSAPYTDSLEFTVSDGDLTSVSYLTLDMYNTPPSAQNDNAVVVKNTLNNRIVLGLGDVDILDSLSVTILPGVTKYGQATLEKKSNVELRLFADNWYSIDNALFTVVYTPTTGVVQNDVIQFSVTDGYDSTIGTININIINTAPVAVSDSANCSKNLDTTIDVLANDSDPNGDNIELAPFTPFLTKNGAKVEQVGSLIKYTAANGFSGVDTFTYTITDVQQDPLNALTNSATVSVTVVNDAPIAVGDTASVGRKLNQLINVLINDSDPNFDPISVVSLGPIQNSNTASAEIVIVNGTTQVNYTGGNEVGVTQFTYIVSDGEATAQGTVSVTQFNNIPVAVDDSASLLWNRIVTIRAISNDTDENPGDVLSIYSSTQPSHGSITNDGSIFTYTPSKGFVGSDQFTYRVTDGIDASTGSATVKVTVNNNAPVSGDNAASTHWRSSVLIDVLTNDSDPDSDALTISASSLVQPKNGTIAIEGNKIRYTPVGQFVGPVTFTYRCTDGNKESNNAVVTVNVINNAPIANADSYSVHWRGGATTLDVLANDSDIDGDSLTITSISLSGTFKGVVQISADKKTLTFDPNTSFVGTQTFIYFISDGPNTQKSATVTISTTNPTVPQASSVNKVVHWSSQSVGTLITVFPVISPVDNDGDSLSVTISNIATNGAAVIESGAGGTYIRYTQNNNYLGNDSFVYTITDGTASANVVVTYTVYNTRPQASDFATNSIWRSFIPNFSIDTIIAAGANDIDLPDKVVLKSITPKTFSGKGTLSILSSGSSIMFVPVQGFVGSISTIVTFTDGIQDVSVNYTVTIKNTLPVASPKLTQAHWSSTTQSQGISIDVLSQIVDADSDIIQNLAVVSATNGNAIIESGRVKFSQTSSNTGLASIKCSFSDGWQSTSATWNVSISNSAPVAVSQSFTSHWRLPSGILLDVLNGCSDADVLDTLTLFNVTKQITTVGQVSLESSKARFYPGSNFVGTDRFDYTVTDGYSFSTRTSLISLTNTKPVAVNDQVTMHWRTAAISYSVLDNDYDVESDPFTLNSITASPQRGVAVIDSANKNLIKYTIASPVSSASLGSFNIAYNIKDAELSASSAILAVTVVNADKPSTTPVSAAYHWRAFTGVSFAIAPALVDQDGDSLSVSVTTNPASFVITSDTSSGALKLSVSAPTSSWKVGNGVVTYNLSDGIESSTNTINITVYNNAPSAADFALNMHWSQLTNGYYFDVLSQASDLDILDANQLSISTQFGTASLNAGSNVTIAINPTTQRSSVLYKPATGFTGTDVFYYYISDGLDKTLAKVNITVASIVTTSADQFYTYHWSDTQPNSPKTFPLIANLNIAQSSTLELISPLKTGPAHGIVVLIGQQEVSYIQDSNFIGTDSFQIDYQDGTSGDNSTITVTVSITNTKPTVVSRQLTAHRLVLKNGFDVDVLTGSADADSDSLTLASATSDYGVVVASGSSIHFTASDPLTVGSTKTVNFFVSDGVETTQGAINVVITNDPPVTYKKSLSVHWRSLIGSSWQLNVLNGSYTGHPTSTGSIDYDVNANDVISVVAISAASPAAAASVSQISATPLAAVVLNSPYVVNSKISFTYTVTDGASNGQVSQTVELTAFNSVPVANNDIYTVKWSDSLVQLPVLSNDVDADAADSTNLQISGKSSVGGTVSISNDKTQLIYTPPTKFVGQHTVTYTVSDGASSSSALVTVNVTNSAPKTVALTQTMKWADISSAGISFDVVSTVVDSDGDAISLLTYVSGLQAGHNITYNGGVLIFKPHNGFTGTTSFQYYVTDSIAVVSGIITVTITNVIPTSTTNVFSRHWRTSTGVLDLGVYLSDTDPLQLLSVVAASGTVSIVPGTLTVQYNQTLKFVGTTTFTVGFTDGWAPTAAQQFTVKVTNNVPVVYAVPISSFHDRAIVIPITNRTDSLKATDSDSADGPYLTVVNSFSGAIPDGTKISVTADNAAIVVVPVHGSLLPVTIVYSVTDGVATSSQSITITLTNTAPVLSNFTKTIHWSESPLGVVFSDVLQGSSDAENDNLSVTNVQLATGTPGTVSKTNSTVKYYPVINTAGTNVMQYIVSDGATTTTGTLTVNVINAIPTATSFNVYKRWNETTFVIPLTGKVSDADSQDLPNLTPTGLTSSFASVVGNSIRFSKVLAPSELSTTFNIGYKVTDKLATSAQSNIAVTFTDAAPVANSYSSSMKWNGSPVDVDVLSLCSDADDVVFVSLIGTVAPSKVSQLTQTSIQGTLALKTPGVLITYTPSSQMPYPQSGLSKSYVSTWTFTCSDGFLNTVGNVAITVTNTQPSALDSNQTVASVGGQRTYVVSNFFANRIDDDGDSLSFINVQGATISGTDAIITVDSDQVTSKSFTYQLTDGQLASRVATVNVLLTNMPPVCADQYITVNKGDSWTSDVSGLCIDQNGHSMTVSIITQPTIGSALQDSTTSLTYTAVQNQSGTLSFTYSATDSYGATSSISTVFVSVVNRSPRALDSTWNLLARRDNNTSTYDFLNASSATDDDTYDQTRLTIVQIVPGTCNGAGQLSIVNNQISLVRPYSFSNSTCQFSVVIQDSDANNVMSSTNLVTLAVTTLPLLALDQTITVVDQDTFFTLSRAQIVSSVSDPLGGSFVFDSWIVDSSTCAQPGFCRQAAAPTANGNSFDFTQKSVQCQIDRFKFKVQSTTDPSIWAVAILNVQYTNCVCNVPADVILVFDGSGSVGATNWKKMTDFAYQLVSNFKFAEDSATPDSQYARFGIVRFGSYIETMLAMTNSKSATLTAIQNLAYPAGGTPILDALRLAEFNLKKQGRPSVVNKIILTMFDGEPNGPCSCTDCRNRYATATTYTPIAYNTTQSEVQCKSLRFPYRTCNSCDINKNYALRCNPCSDIIPLTTSINSRKPDMFGNAPNGYWRVIPVGIGQALSSAIAQRLLQDMSYDPSRSFFVNWDQLTQLYQTVSDQTCNMVDISSTAQTLTILEPNEPNNMKCGDFIMMRGLSTNVQFAYNDYSTPAFRLANDYTKANVAGTNRTAVWQVVCPSGAYGADIIYGKTPIALWNLQKKQYLRRNAALVNSQAIDTLATVTGTAADMSAGGASASYLSWIASSVGSTTIGTKVYTDNCFCLGSGTFDANNTPKTKIGTEKFHLDAANTAKYPIATSACSSTGQTIFFTPLKWKGIQNLAAAPALTPDELPMTIPPSEYQ